MLFIVVKGRVVCAVCVQRLFLLLGRFMVRVLWVRGRVWSVTSSSSNSSRNSVV